MDDLMYSCAPCGWLGDSPSTTERKEVDHTTGQAVRLWLPICPRCFAPVHPYKGALTEEHIS
jgi:hypothetical protein